MKEELASIIDLVNVGTGARGFDAGRCQRFRLSKTIPGFFFLHVILGHIQLKSHFGFYRGIFNVKS